MNISPALTHHRSVLCNIQFFCYSKLPSTYLLDSLLLLQLQVSVVPELSSITFDHYLTSASGFISCLWSSRNKIYETCLVCVNLPYLDMEITYYCDGSRTRSPCTMWQRPQLLQDTVMLSYLNFIFFFSSQCSQTIQCTRVSSILDVTKEECRLAYKGPRSLITVST